MSMKKIIMNCKMKRQIINPAKTIVKKNYRFINKHQKECKIKYKQWKNN